MFKKLDESSKPWMYCVYDLLVELSSMTKSNNKFNKLIFIINIVCIVIEPIELNKKMTSNI